MKSLFKLLVCALLLYLVGSKLMRGFGPSELGRVSLTTNAANPDDPCEGKRRCMVAFVAPWCPACHASIPFLLSLKRMVAASSDLGMQIVIGAGEMASLQEMGKEFGEPVYYDPSGKMQAAMGGGGIPRWVVIDANRKVLNYGSGLPSEDDSVPGIKEYIRDRLKFS